MASRKVLSALRALRRPLLLLLLLGPWAAAGHAGKYSREKNEPAPPSKREPAAEFRMEKLNQLWEKAQRVSGGRVPPPRGSAGQGVLWSWGPQSPGPGLFCLEGPRGVL